MVFSADQEAEGIVSTQLQEGIALLKTDANAYIPLTYTRKDCILGLGPSTEETKSALQALGISCQGTQVAADPAFIRNRPGIIVLEAAKVTPRRTLVEPILRKRKERPEPLARPIIPGKDSVNPFGFKAPRLVESTGDRHAYTKNIATPLKRSPSDGTSSIRSLNLFNYRMFSQNRSERI